MPPTSRLEVPLALACLVPALLLAVPAVLAGELEPEASAAGWWTLAALLPAGLLALGSLGPAEKAAPRHLPITLFGAGVLLCLASLEWGPGTDTFQGARAVMISIASLSALHAGAGLGAAGRGALGLGLAALSILFSAGGLAGVSPRFQGALQNSGATSEAALLGALAALALGLDPGRSVRLLSAAAVATYGAFVGAAPVLSGALVFLLVAAAMFVARRAERKYVAWRAGLFLLAAAPTYLALRAADDPAPTAPTALEAALEAAALPPVPGGHLGGLAVRLALAPGALALWRDHLWLGVGPGQFRAAFPPYRSAEERELSTRAGAGRETEVEHAHDDYLTQLAEAGLLGGGLWIAVQLLLASCALGTLRSGDPWRVGLALAVLGGVTNAALRAPLTFNPAGASLYFAAVGALLAGARGDSPASPARRLGSRGLTLLGLALLLVQAPTALEFVRHGRALRLPDGLNLPAALAARPDSPLALALTARSLAAQPERRGEAREVWERLLVLRPHSFEALVQAGVLAAEGAEHGDAGLAARARDHWRRAAELAPERGGVAWNLLLFEAREAGEEEFAAALARAAPRVERARAQSMGSRELLSGDERAGLRLWRFAGVPWVEEAPQALYDRARAAGAEPGPEGQAMEALAHLRWAREHALLRDYAACVRSLRQALRLAPGARLFRLELAAALAGDGKLEEARAEIERAAPRTRDWSRLEPWAGEVLFAAGLFAAR
jgi:tetratricopeptide (TPR) repeat protein